MLHDRLIKAAWQTVDRFARRDPKLKGKSCAHSVLYSNNGRPEYHPHVHLIVPAGVVDEKEDIGAKGRASISFLRLIWSRSFAPKSWLGSRRLD